jgi:hypothetical protein
MIRQWAGTCDRRPEANPRDREGAREQEGEQEMVPSLGERTGVRVPAVVLRGISQVETV